jgi:hypothetical protein
MILDDQKPTGQAGLRAVLVAGMCSGPGSRQDGMRRLLRGPSACPRDGRRARWGSGPDEDRWAGPTYDDPVIPADHSVRRGLGVADGRRGPGPDDIRRQERRGGSPGSLRGLHREPRGVSISAVAQQLRDCARRRPDQNQARGGARGLDGRSTAGGQESGGPSAGRIRTTSVQGPSSGSATSCP